jgi:polar amino acid transport system substrate-binding protein
VKPRLYLLLLFILSLNVFSETLKWAADAESGAPYVFQDPKVPSRLIGFEVDIVKAISDELGVKTEFFQNQWAGLIPGLDRNNYDFAINGLEITEDRKNEVYFSIPYYITFEKLIVRADENSIDELSDLKGKKVGTLSASLAERILMTEGGIEVKGYDSEVNSFEDLKMGRLDAVFIDEPVANYYAGWNPGLKLVGEGKGEVVYGICVKKGNDSLLAKIDYALQNIIDNGKLRIILEKWNMWNHKMAEYTGDFAETSQEPTEFERFIAYQMTELTFSDYIKRYIGFLPRFADAAWMTLKLSVLAMFIASFFGILIALVRIYAPFPFNNIAVFYIEVVRGTPLLIQLIFIFYALPQIGITLPPFIAAITALGINYSAYEAEVYRSGLFAVPRGQMEAALSLGMRRRDALRFIIVPQALRIVIPPVTNDFISLLKDSSLVSIIALTELTKLYGQISSTYFDYIGTGIIIAAIYLLMGLPFVKISKMAEKYFTYNSKK